MGTNILKDIMLWLQYQPPFDVSHCEQHARALASPHVTYQCIVRLHLPSYCYVLEVIGILSTLMMLLKSMDTLVTCVLMLMSRQWNVKGRLVQLPHHYYQDEEVFEGCVFIYRPLV